MLDRRTLAVCYSETMIGLAIKRTGMSVLFGLGFFMSWAILMSIVMANEALINPTRLQENHALLRLWQEAVPLLAVLAATWLFAGKIGGEAGFPPLAGKDWVKSLLFGALVGAGWLITSTLLLVLMGWLQLEGTNHVSALAIWFSALAINVIMQEYLVRGYLFLIIKERHSMLAAVIITTILFTLMHGLQGGVLGVANVVAASLVFTLLLVRTGSLLAPIVAHIVWNGVGGVLLGVISLGGVYPSLLAVSQHGNDIVAGGEAMLEGSIITLLVSITVILGLWLIKPRLRSIAGSTASNT